MKSTGIIRRLDALGRVVIPREVRRAMNYGDDEPLEFFPDPENRVLILKNYKPGNEVGEVAASLLQRVEANREYLRNGVAISEKVREIIEMLEKSEAEEKL